MTNVQYDLRRLTVNFVRSAEVVEDTQDLLMQQVERFWATETVGVETKSKACTSMEDKKALRTMEQSVKLQDGHYQVALPWREFPPFLPYNRSLVERRLQMLKRRLLQDNELFKNYKGKMENIFLTAIQSTARRASCEGQAAMVLTSPPRIEQAWKD